MLNSIHRLTIASLLALGIAVFADGCAANKSAGAAGEQRVTLAQLTTPAAARTAAKKYVRTSTGLKAMKDIEYGETHYEVEGPKNGKTVEATFDPRGKRTK